MKDNNYHRYDFFAKPLKRRRKELSYKQKDLAIAVGVSVESIRNWEQGRVLPSYEKLIELSKILECDCDYLLGTMDYSTHDIQFIHDQTGLSEKTISKLLTWKDEEPHRIRYLSRIIEDSGLPEYLDLIRKGIYDQVDTEGSFRTKGNIAFSEYQISQLDNSKDAYLFKLSRISTDMVERVIDGEMLIMRELQEREKDE